jgi:hypothetical protein
MVVLVVEQLRHCRAACSRKPDRIGRGPAEHSCAGGSAASPAVSGYAASVSSASSPKPRYTAFVAPPSAAGRGLDCGDTTPYC